MSVYLHHQPTLNGCSALLPIFCPWDAVVRNQKCFNHFYLSRKMQKFFKDLSWFIIKLYNRKICLNWIYWNLNSELELGPNSN
jgi:hypothetical protein